MVTSDIHFIILREPYPAKEELSLPPSLFEPRTPTLTMQDVIDMPTMHPKTSKSSGACAPYENPPLQGVLLLQNRPPAAPELGGRVARFLSLTARGTEATLSWAYA